MTREKNRSAGEPATTIGQRLLEAREQRGVTPSEVAAITKMMEKHVIAMENNQFAALGAPVYAKGFIKLYAEFLGLDSQALLKEYARKYQRGPGGSSPTGIGSLVVDKMNDSSAPSPAARPAAGDGRPEARQPAAKPLPWDMLSRWAIQGGVVLVLAVLLVGTVLGTRSCVTAGQRRQSLKDRQERDRVAVIEEAPEPYLDVEPRGTPR